MEKTMGSDAADLNIDFGTAFDVALFAERPSILFVCEHASSYIPFHLNNLGLSREVKQSHIAWDPGALGVAMALAPFFSSVLFHGTISRLVYDCNRPPESESATPSHSECYDIPGNKSLSAKEREQRIQGVYQPFSKGLSHQITQHRESLCLMVTVHSFTPVFNAKKREVEIGILNGADNRFARAMMHHRPQDGKYDIRLNEPYTASDGVAHTLDVHGAKNGLPNVMIEIRNDLIATPEAEHAMGEYLAYWIKMTLETFSVNDPHHEVFT